MTIKKECYVVENKDGTYLRWYVDEYTLEDVFEFDTIEKAYQFDTKEEAVRLMETEAYLNWFHWEKIMVKKMSVEYNIHAI